MKLSVESREELIRKLSAKVAEGALSLAEISRISGVHESQTSRIIGGKFKTLSASVMQICRTLGVDPDADPVAMRLNGALYRLWDGSPEDADRIVRVLDGLANLRLK